jgi:hypothetical protein
MNSPVKGVAMKKYVKKKVLKEGYILESNTCDKCGIELNNENTKNGGYIRNEFELSWQIGYCWSEGPSYTEYKLDSLCDKCKILLFNTLIDFGFKIIEVESENYYNEDFENV